MFQLAFIPVFYGKIYKIRDKEINIYEAVLDQRSSHGTFINPSISPHPSSWIITYPSGETFYEEFSSIKKTPPCKRRSSSKLRWEDIRSIKVLVFKTWEQKDLGYLRTLLTCLASRAWLNTSISLKSKPPFFLQRYTLSQLIQYTFLWFSEELHQKSAMALVSDSQVDFGSLKHVMAWIGIASATALRTSSFPPWD